MLLAIHGIKVVFDSHRYLRQAGLLEAGEFSSLKISYIVYTCLLSLSVWLGSLHWIVLLQMTLAALAVIALYRATLQLSQSRLAAALTAFLLIAWPDFQFWNLYVHTESLFVSVTIFIFWRLVTASRPRHYLQLSLLLLLVLFLRPNGFMVVLSALVYLGVGWCQVKGYSLWKAGGLLFLLTGMAMVLAARFFLNDISSDHGFTGHLVSGYVIQGYKPLHIAYEVPAPVTGSPFVQTISLVVQEPVFFFKKSAARLLFYWGQVRPYYSLKHNLVIALLMYPLYFLGLLALARRQVSVAVIGFIAAMALQHSAMAVVSAVDWDNRFFLPLLPFVFMAGAMGFATMVGRMSSHQEHCG